MTPKASVVELAGSDKPFPLALMTTLDTLQNLLALEDEASPNVFPFDLVAKAAALPPLLAPAGRKPPPPKLDTLGYDVLELIFDYIHSGYHLRNCLKVNRTLRSHALSRLYETIHIDVDDWTEESHKELLSKTHSGIQYVKTLGFYPRASGIIPDSAHRWIKAFLSVLREGQLRSVSWVCEWSMPLDLMQYVWETQPNISRLHLGGTVKFKGQTTKAGLMEKLDATHFTRVTELELTPNCLSVVQAASKILQEFKNIDSLVVDGLIWNHSDPSRESTDEDSAVRDKLTTALFDHRPRTIPRTLKTKWAGLRSLWISDINMRYCRDTWFAYLDLRNLDYLHISYCPHADVFLTELMRTQPPQLKDFTFIHGANAGACDSRTPVELEDFLNLIKGRLRRLEICLRNTWPNLLPGPINRHRATLECLHLDIYRTSRGSQINYQVANSMALEQLLTGCEKLSQLAIALPLPKLTYRTFREESDFSRAINTILSTVNLSTLNILNIPVNFGLGRSTSYYIALQPQLESLATEIFNHIYSRRGDPSLDTSSSKAQSLSPSITPASPTVTLPPMPPPPPALPPPKTRHLQILALGTRERSPTYPLPRYFIPATSISAPSRARVRGEPISLHKLVSDGGWETYILDYDWRDFGGKNSRREWADLEFFADEDGESRERYSDVKGEWRERKNHYVVGVGEQDREATSDGGAGAGGIPTDDAWDAWFGDGAAGTAAGAGAAPLPLPPLPHGVTGDGVAENATADPFEGWLHDDAVSAAGITDAEFEALLAPNLLDGIF